MHNAPKHNGRWWLLAALLPGLGAPARVQVASSADTTAVTAARAFVGQTYQAALGLTANLYAGAEYVENVVPAGTEGHQFFESAQPQSGFVDCQGGHYAGVVLRYDIVRDQLVLPYPGQAIQIMVPTAKVAGFGLGGHRFVRVVGSPASQPPVTAGFYEVLADGPVRLLARHTKQLTQTHGPEGLGHAFRQADQLFVSTSATAVTEVTSLRRLVALLPAHQAEVQRYASQQKLRFGADQRMASATQVMHYYYTLRP